MPIFDPIYEDPHFSYSQFHLFYYYLSDCTNLIRIIQHVQTYGATSKLNFTTKIKKLIWKSSINSN